MRDVLAEICAEKRAHVARAKAARSEAALLAGISPRRRRCGRLRRRSSGISPKDATG